MPTKLTTKSLLAALAGVATLSAYAMASEWRLVDPEDEQAVVEELFRAIELDPDHDHDHNHAHDQHIAHAQGQGSGNTATTYTLNKDGDKVIVRIVNGKISGLHNGLALDPDRIKKTDDEIIVLNLDGDQIARFKTGSQQGVARLALPGRGSQIAVAPRAPMVPGAPGAGGGWAQVYSNALPSDANPPEVMVGLTMGEPGESLLLHFGLEPGDAIMVTGTIDGLPADKAGIKKGDLIVAIDGDSPATPRVLQEALEDMDPGDELEVTVIQRGKKRDIEIRVAKYDAKAMASASSDEADIFYFDTDEGDGQGGNLFRRLNTQRGQAENMQQRAQELALKLQAQAQAGEINKESIELYLKELAEANPKLNELKLRVDPKFNDAVRGFMVPRGLGNEWQGDLEAYVGHLHGEMEDMTARLHEKIESQLEARLDRLERMLEHLVERIEQDDNDNRRRGGRGEN